MQEQLRLIGYHSAWTNNYPQPPVGGSYYDENPPSVFLGILTDSDGTRQELGNTCGTYY